MEWLWLPCVCSGRFSDDKVVHDAPQCLNSQLQHVDLVEEGDGVPHLARNLPVHPAMHFTRVAIRYLLSRREGERYGPAGGDAVMLSAADEMQVRFKARQGL